MVVPNEQPKKPTKPKSPAKPRKSHERSLPVPVSAAALNVINPDAAGIDVHSDMHIICVPADRDASPVRQFGANTADLQEVVAWLKKCRVRTIALESTGVYWISLFELLESEGFEVNLVEPGQLSRCGAAPARRTCSTRSGSNGCTPTVSCVRRFASGFRARAACLLAAAADAGALRRQSCPAHAESHGANQCQTDGSRQRHHGADRHVDHQCHPGGRTRPHQTGPTAQ